MQDNDSTAVNRPREPGQTDHIRNLRINKSGFFSTVNGTAYLDNGLHLYYRSIEDQQEGFERSSLDQTLYEANAHASQPTKGEGQACGPIALKTCCIHT